MRYAFWMWRSAVLTEIPRRARDLLGLQPARQHPDDLGLALGQSGRPLEARRRLPGRLDHRRHRVGVEPPGLGLLARARGRLLGGSGSRCGRGSVIA